MVKIVYQRRRACWTMMMSMRWWDLFPHFGQLGHPHFLIYPFVLGSADMGVDYKHLLFTPQLVQEHPGSSKRDFFRFWATRPLLHYHSLSTSPLFDVDRLSKLSRQIEGGPMDGEAANGCSIPTVSGLTFQPLQPEICQDQWTVEHRS